MSPQRANTPLQGLDVHWQWEQYQVSTATLEPSTGAISPVIDLPGWQKAIWKGRAVIISYVVEAVNMDSYLV